jgi:hypothetical protein
MAGEVSQYDINGINLYDNFGFVAESGKKGLLMFPKSKETYKKNWGDQNGSEYDLSARYFEDNTAVLSGAIVAQGSADFWTKYDGLRDLLVSNDAKTLYAHNLNRNFSVYYDEMTDLDPLTPFSPSDQIIVKISLSFIVMWPVSGIELMNNVYYGVSSTNEILTGAEIISGTPKSIQANENYIINFGNLVSQYSWFAEDIGQPIKTKYQDVNNTANAGNMLSSNDLFNAPITVDGFRFYITNYKTILSHNFKFIH